MVREVVVHRAGRQVAAGDPFAAEVDVLGLDGAGEIGLSDGAGGEALQQGQVVFVWTTHAAGEPIAGQSQPMCIFSYPVGANGLEVLLYLACEKLEDRIG
jgi:hypothetical protein